MKKLIVTAGVLAYADGSPVPTEVWQEWQQATVAAHAARQRTEDALTRKDRRIGRGVEWTRGGGSWTERHQDDAALQASAQRALQSYLDGTLFA